MQSNGAGHPCSIQHRLHRCSAGNQTAWRSVIIKATYLEDMTYTSPPTSICTFVSKPAFHIFARLVSTLPACVPKLLLWSRYLCKTQTAERWIFKFLCPLSVLSARQLITFVAAAVPAPRGLLRLERLCGKPAVSRVSGGAAAHISPPPSLLWAGAGNFSAIRSLQLFHLCKKKKKK